MKILIWIAVIAIGALWLVRRVANRGSRSR